MKPFIKPSPATATATEASSTPRISPNELTIFGVASSLTDPQERSAFLDRACGDDLDLRVRIEERLAVRLPHRPTPPEPELEEILPSSPLVTSAIRPMTEATVTTTTVNGDRHDAVALVPMSTMQLAAMQQPPRHSPVPWFLATLMAMGVGALSVLLYLEKTDRKDGAAAEAPASKPVAAVADRKEPPMAAKTSPSEISPSAEALRLAQLKADHSGKTAESAIKERDAALMEAAKVKSEIAQQRKEWEQALVREKTATDRAQSAVSEVTKLRNDVSATLRDNTLTLADSLARLGSMQMDDRQYADAAANLRQALQLRESLKMEPWVIVENQALLGNALLQTSADAEALQHFQSAAANMEALGAPTNDADRARATAASKKIVQFFNITGRRKEGTEWKKRLDAIMAAPRPAVVN